MNVPTPSSNEFGLRERLRSAESRLRSADVLANAAESCLLFPDSLSLRELRYALDNFREPALLGAPGRLLADHRLTPVAGPALGAARPRRARRQTGRAVLTAVAVEADE